MISKSRAFHGRVNGYMSGLEESVGRQLHSLRIPFAYESHRIPYIGKPHKYTPDFKIGNIYIETKGRFLARDRAKHLLVKEQHPDLDIRFVFTNPNAKLNKRSKTTYARWCDKHGFKYAKGRIPDSWILEMRRD